MWQSKEMPVNNLRVFILSANLVTKLENMILTDKEILKNINYLQSIIIEPFDLGCLGTNSYDVHLGKYLAYYTASTIDARVDNKTEEFEIPEEGYVLDPGKVYLGATTEYTETHLHVPFLEGKSSIGRLGIDIHATAGKGDVGFCGHWTLEVSCKQPVRIYAGMPIGQLIYFEVRGEIQNLYNKKEGAKYNNRNPHPQSSRMWMNDFFRNK